MSNKKERVTIPGDAKKDKPEYELILYITGATPNSMRAITNVKQLCEDHLKGRYSLQIIDVYQQGALAAEEQLVALPVFIKRLPLPQRRMIGDMSDTKKVLKGLGLLP